MQALRDMKYSGRGICVGLTHSRNPFMAYTLTGRSSSSQARKLVRGDSTSTIRTEVTDPEQLAQGSAALLIYPAIVSLGRALIASNGAQTELLYSAMMRNSSGSPEEILRDALRKPQLRYDKGTGKSGDQWIDITTYEPDDPNFTPRISALLRIDDAAVHSVHRGYAGSRIDVYHSFSVEPGKGRMITTYRGGNETPLVPFTGDPFSVEVPEKDIGAIADAFYHAIRGPVPENNFRVAVAVVVSDRDTGRLEYAIRNRSELGE